MGILDDRDWFKLAGASPFDIEQLRQVAPFVLPDAYLNLLAETNGGEGPLPVNPFNLVLDSASEAAAGIREGKWAHLFGDLADRFVVIGGNGGGEGVALDARRFAPWPVVCFDMVNAKLEESVTAIAPSMDAFISMIGQSK